MKSDSLPAIALALLASGILVVKAEESRGEPATKPEAPAAPPAAEATPKDAIKAIEAEIEQLREERERLMAERAKAQKPAEKLPRLIHFGPGSVIFAGLVERAADGKPRMMATWKGRVPSDFETYIDNSTGPGPWLIGRIGGELLREDLKPTRFCYQVTPEGEIVGFGERKEVKLEVKPVGAAAAPEPEYEPSARVKLEELRKSIQDAPQEK